MEISITGECPNCGTAIRIIHKDEENNPYKLDDFAFEIIKEASKRAYSVDRFIKGYDSAPLFQDVMDFFNDYKPKKAIDIIEKELGSLKERIELTNGKEELLELAKQVVKFDVRVSGDIKEMIRRDKANLIEMLKKKILGMKIPKRQAKERKGKRKKAKKRVKKKKN